MSSRVSKGLIEKLQAVRDGYEAIGQYNNSTIDKLIQQNLNELLLKSVFNGDRATIKWCNKELAKEKMSHRLRRAVSLVPSGILDSDDDEHLNPFSGNPSQFPEFTPAHLNRNGGKSRKMKGKKGKKGKKSIRRRKN